MPWEFLRPGHTCAITSASTNALFYRSSSIAIYDLARDAGVALFGGIRPGCWINMIPANGLVLVPEASVGCTCSFPLRGSFALVNKPQRAQPWTVFINHTELDPKGQVVPSTFERPVKHLGINFGAPADMKDNERHAVARLPESADGVHSEPLCQLRNQVRSEGGNPAGHGVFLPGFQGGDHRGNGDSPGSLPPAAWDCAAARFRCWTTRPDQKPVGIHGSSRVPGP